MVLVSDGSLGDNIFSLKLKKLCDDINDFYCFDINVYYSVCFLEVPTLGRRSNTFVIYQDVVKSMGKPHIWERIYVGILESVLLFVTGCSVAKDLHEVMNYKGTEEHTQVTNTFMFPPCAFLPPF